ncbi:type II secretion system protein GspK [Methylobacterium nigriterrae]|uniref:type II secretion system protein GspK n=1 Tax=Methylobacterium nigriterrae TaxID=3127512 RepID=UPI0030136B07
MRTSGGFILVSVLGVLAILAGLVGTTALLTRAAVDGIDTALEEMRLDALVQAGAELAAYQLLGLKRPAREVTGQSIRLDDGTVRLFVSDESGKIDLNGADPALLAGAYDAAGLRTLEPRTFAAEVVALRERLPVQIASSGGGGGSVDRARNRDAFRTVGELQWLPQVSAADAAVLSAFVTVHNPQGKVNILAAPDGVLLALPGLTPALLDAIRSARQLPAAKAREVLAEGLGSLQQFLSMRSGSAFRLRLEAQRGSGAARSAEAVIIRSPTRDAPYLQTEWRP